MFGRSGFSHFFEDNEGLSSHSVVSFADDLDDLSEGLEEIEQGVLHIYVGMGVPLGLIF